MDSVHIETSPSGKKYIFEATDTHLLPYDPLAKKITSNKRRSSEISDTSKVEVSSFGTKDGIGKTGVYHQYHNPPEYDTLSKDQKEELCEWQLKNPNSTSHTEGRDNKLSNRNNSIAAAMDKQVEKALPEVIKAAETESSPDDPTDNQARAYIMSLLNDIKDETIPVKHILNKVNLKSILGEANTPPQMTSPVNAILCIPLNTIQEGREG